MKLHMNQETTVNAPAGDVWHVLAHEFDQIGRWSAGISESMAIVDLPVPEGATVGGRACLTPGFGSDAQEEFTYYDEETMRFGYQATGEIPWSLSHAENNWSVQALDAYTSRVAFRAEVEANLFPGLLLMPMIKLYGGRLGRETLEELKYYVEEGQPHPRKVKAQRKQMQTA